MLQIDKADLFSIKIIDETVSKVLDNTQVFLMVIIMVILGPFCATDLFLIRETTDRILLISQDLDHEHAFEWTDSCKML